jgi:hypothetical protein
VPPSTARSDLRVVSCRANVVPVSCRVGQPIWSSILEQASVISLMHSEKTCCRAASSTNPPASCRRSWPPAGPTRGGGTSPWHVHRCADVLTITMRDLISMTGGPFYPLFQDARTRPPHTPSRLSSSSCSETPHAPPRRHDRHQGGLWCRSSSSSPHRAHTGGSRTTPSSLTASSAGTPRAVAPPRQHHTTRP